MKEVAALWQTLDIPDVGIQPGMRIAIRLQILSGTRADQWLGAPQSELKLDLDPAHLEIPVARLKTGRFKRTFPHIIPLTPSMRRLVDAALIVAGASPYLFPNRRHLSKPMRRTSYTDAFNRLADHAGVKLGNYESTHLLRHTVTTELARLGVSPHIGEALMGHTEPGERSTYNKWQYVPEKLEALLKWEAELLRATVTQE